MTTAKRSLCSFPHGTYIVFPFLMITVSVIMSFKTISSCDLIKTQWSINCATPTSSNCVYITSLDMGLLVKESLVDGSNGDGDPEMLKTCKWMNEKERNWLVDRTWTVSLILQAACILFGFMSMVIILMSSCCSIRKGLFRIMSIGFGANAMLNMTPMIIFLKSELCTGNDGAGICDESQTNCVSTCEMSSGSWQLLATSFMWISAMISAWVISPQEKIFSIQESDGMQDEESPDDKSSQTLRSSSTSSLESDEEDTPDNGNVMYNVNL